MARLLKVSGRAGRWTPLGKGWSSVSASIVAAWVIMVLSAFQVVQAAAPVVESSSSKSNINTSSVTRLDVSIDRPADTQVGDLLVASVRVTRDGSVTN